MQPPIQEASLKVPPPRSTVNAQASSLPIDGLICRTESIELQPKRKRNRAPISCCFFRLCETLICRLDVPLRRQMSQACGLSVALYYVGPPPIKLCKVLAPKAQLSPHEARVWTRSQTRTLIHFADAGGVSRIRCNFADRGTAGHPVRCSPARQGTPTGVSAARGRRGDAA